MKHKAFQSAIYKQYDIICWYIANSFLLLERHHVTITVSKTYRMSRRAECQLFSWHAGGDEHFGGITVLLDAIKHGVLSMKYFLLPIRNQSSELRIPHFDALSLKYRDSLWRACSLFGSVASGFESYTVNSRCNTGHFFLFFFFFLCLGSLRHKSPLLGVVICLREKRAQGCRLREYQASNYSTS